MRVTGTSMLPALRPRDIVTVERCGPGDVEAGEVVLFMRQGRLFVHRVVERAGARFLTRGDAVAFCDTPVVRGELLGKVAHLERRGRPVRLPRTPPVRQRLAAALFRRSPLACRVFSRLDAGLP